MKLKTFKLFESGKSNRTDNLKAYFMNIEDAYDVEINYNETTSDYYNIVIKFPDISNSLEELNTRYKHISEILSLIKRNTKKIEEDYIVDEFEVYQNRITFNLYYNVGDINNLSIDQLFVLDEDEFVVRVNSYKMKKVFKEKYDLQVSTISITGELDDNDEPYSLVSAKVENIGLGRDETWTKSKTGGVWKWGQGLNENRDLIIKIVTDFQKIYGLSKIHIKNLGIGDQCLINFYLDVPVE